MKSDWGVVNSGRMYIPHADFFFFRNILCFRAMDTTVANKAKISVSSLRLRKQVKCMFEELIIMSRRRRGGLGNMLPLGKIFVSIEWYSEIASEVNFWPKVYRRLAASKSAQARTGVNLAA